VATGVDLIVKDMHEVSHIGRDRYVTGDVIISVTCKPKLLYPSSSTNWANDLYADRLQFPEEREIKDTGVDELTRQEKSALVIVQDITAVSSNEHERRLHDSDQWRTSS
jgi:hypothetical protein